jgi:hypothetical protein
MSNTTNQVIDELNKSAGPEEDRRDEKNLEAFLWQMEVTRKMILRMADDNLQLMQSLAALMDKIEESQHKYNELLKNFKTIL